MVEILWNTSPESEEHVLDESRQDLSYLKKEIENQESLSFSQKIPPSLKNVYKKLLKINSKKDINNFQITWKEMELLINLHQKYSTTHLWYKLEKKLKNIFNVRGNLSFHQENFRWLKLLTFNIGQKNLFSINYTTLKSRYSSWKLWNTSVVVERTSTGGYLRDIDGNKLEGWVSIMSDGNLMSIDENWIFDKKTYLFWDGLFDKWSNGNLLISPTPSPNTMLAYVYTKKKEKIWRIPYTRSLENMWYSLERNDTNQTVKIIKNTIHSKFSEPILSYTRDKDFVKWMESAKKVIDSGIFNIEKKEEQFEDFYNKYFNASGTYKENTRYEIVREWWVNFYLIDKHNKHKEITDIPVSIFDERGRLLMRIDIEAMIRKYEAEEIYYKFIAKNNNKNVVNSKWVHVENRYYLWYPFLYNSHVITLERTPFTEWKYAIIVRKQWTDNIIWKINLDNFMSASDIEKEIDTLIK